MTHSVSEMIRQRYGNRYEGGMLFLMLIASVAYLAHSAFIDHDWGKAMEDGDIFLQIEGCVNVSGTYSFHSGARLGDLIERAGGLSIEKDLPAAYNKRTLHSGARVAVERSGMQWQVFITEISAFNKLTLGIPISINSESKEGLTAIQGIGPRLAEAIVKERSKKGGFSKISEVKKIKGIGDRLYEKIMPHITLREELL